MFVFSAFACLLFTFVYYCLFLFFRWVLKEMQDGIYGNGGGGQGPPSVGSGRQSYTHQGSFLFCFWYFSFV